MHKFLRSIGISNIKTKKELDQLVTNVVQNPTEKLIEPIADDLFFVQTNKEFGNGYGIAVVGECDPNGIFSMDYYFPYFRGNHVLKKENVQLERHAAHESYAGVCDDDDIGVAIIYYVNNPGEFKQYYRHRKTHHVPDSLALSALSTNATVLLEVANSNKVPEGMSKAHHSLISAAKAGDEDAIEDLALEDLDTYNMITHRIKTEDVLSIVDTYFMPYGIESDQYQVLGQIKEVSKMRNPLTAETVYQILLECNGLVFPVMVNHTDLMGEPSVGRRLRAQIWLQGATIYS